MLQERYINPYTEERQDYEESIKVYRDLTNVVRTAERKGREAGREEGLAEGRAEERMANARSLKAHGVPVDVIVKSLNLTPDEASSL